MHGNDASLDDRSGIAEMIDRFRATIPANARLILALSGGVDSSVVAALLWHQHQDGELRQPPIAVTTDSPSTPRRQLAMAKSVTQSLCIEHRIIAGTEQADVRYRLNDRRRCFHCKTHLYRVLRSIADTHDDGVLVSGTNADDLGDYRPGIQAGNDFDVLTPLADVGLNKSAVRTLARHYGLPNADAPAAPCLASRIVYGVEVNSRRLAMVEQAESLLFDLGFPTCRVRLDIRDGEPIGRVEVLRGEVSRLKAVWESERLSRRIVRMGFAEISIEPDGFRSGRLNDALSPNATTTSPTADRTLPIFDSRVSS